MALLEEPVLSRIHRLNVMLKQLEKIKECSWSPRSSGVSTPSIETLTSDGRTSSIYFSPKNLEKHCRPIDDVLKEAEVKGSMVERLDHIEECLLKLCLQLEQELELEKKREENNEKKLRSRGIKKFVKQCVRF